MRRRFNYTNRITIRKSDVNISVHTTSGPAPVARVSTDLAAYKLPEEAEVFVEAYRMHSYMRSRMGQVLDAATPFEFALTEFDTPDAVLFRLKVVSRRHDLKGTAPIILAAADKLSASDGSDENLNTDRLLTSKPEDLNGELWRLDLEDQPVLLIERAYWENRDVICGPWFRSLVIPTILRTTLRHILTSDFREVEGDDWEPRWLRFALEQPGTPPLPPESADPDVIDNWINDCVAGFSRTFNIRGKVDKLIDGAAR